MTQPLTLWDALDGIERTINDLYVNRTVFSAHTIRVLVEQIRDMKQRVQGHPVGVRTLGQDLRDVERYAALCLDLSALIESWKHEGAASQVYALRLEVVLKQSGGGNEHHRWSDEDR